MRSERSTKLFSHQFNESSERETSLQFSLYSLLAHYYHYPLASSSFFPIFRIDRRLG